MHRPMKPVLWIFALLLVLTFWSNSLQASSECASLLQKRLMRHIKADEIAPDGIWSVHNFRMRELGAHTDLDRLGTWLSGTGDALDIGAGSGADGIAMLEKGFRVHFVDADAPSMRLLEKDLHFLEISPDRYKVEVRRLEDIVSAGPIPRTFDLVNHSYSLGYADETILKPFVAWLPRVVRPGGIVMIDYFGDEDYRVEAGRAFGLSAKSARDLFADTFELVEFTSSTEYDYWNLTQVHRAILKKNPALQ